MDDTELLIGIKTRLGITGNYHDDLLLAYAQDVKDFMLSGGVKPRVINGSTSIGCIARGVADLWNYGAGDGQFSKVFYERVIQLAIPIAGMEDGSEDFDEIPEEDIDGIIDATIPEPEPDYEVMDKDDIDGILSIESSETEDDYEPMDKEDIDNIIDVPTQEEPNEPSDENGSDETEEDYEAIPNEELDDLFK